MGDACWLVLEDGTIMHGRSFGGRREARGEMVFNTSMCGYVESLTDPSYRGQILMMTYPLIGNYGVSPERWRESPRIQVEGFVVRELTGGCMHPRGTVGLDAFLEGLDVPGVDGVDTRTLTKRIRTSGTMRCALTQAADPGPVLEEVRRMEFPERRNLVAEVSTREVIEHPGGRHRMVLLDCGAKMSIVRNLQRYATVVQVPYDTPAEDILRMGPDGLVISNGPGDPSHPDILRTCVKSVRELIGEIPVMGICLGHQILALALGARTFKLKFGHRGVNHPVMEEGTGRVRITSQNHGFAVEDDLPSGLVVRERNLNDSTIESLTHSELDIISMQYHPEANPGPHDSLDIFQEFERMVRDAAAH